LEERPVTTAAASLILSSIIAVAGPQIVAPDESPNPDVSEDKVVEIIDTVLDHYDKLHGHGDGDSQQPRSGP
jgi:hypothetical protein